MRSGSTVGPVRREAIMKKGMTAQEIRRRKLAWKEAMYEASLQKGTLRITFNKLYTIDPDLFQFQQTFGIKLLSLRLIGIELEEIPDEIGIHLHELQILSLENNQIKHIPDNITNLTQLKELYLSFNQISLLPARLGFLPSLERFTINNNKLIEVPITFGALNQLKKVDLECNEIRFLPENLDNMISCESININRNHLQRLPRCLGRMPSLTLLSANWNHIGFLPQELFGSHSLKALRLSMNTIATLPERLGDLAATLQEIALDYNQLHRLPLSFYKLTHLQILRVEGNEALIDPPPEIMNRGAREVVNYCRDQFLTNKQARMRHIILAMQNILEQITERKLYSDAYFEPNVNLADIDGLHAIGGSVNSASAAPSGHTSSLHATKQNSQSLDRWYALQLDHFWSDLLPKLQQTWQLQQQLLTSQSSRHQAFQIDPDHLQEFTFSEKEVLWAFSSYVDANGSIIRRQKAMFRHCACMSPTHPGKRQPCIPPQPGYMCSRTCILLKKRLITNRDKEDYFWQSYKNNGEIDAMKHAEVEANSYLASRAGQQWLDESAYAQAEEVILENEADKIVARRITRTEQRKQAIIKKYDALKKQVNKQRDAKLASMQPLLQGLKEDYKKAQEGYRKKMLEGKMDAIAFQMAHLPEIAELEKLHKQCEYLCEQAEEELYQSSSEDEDDYYIYEEDAAWHHRCVQEDLNGEGYDSDDTSPEADHWRKRRQRIEKKRLQRKQEERQEAERILKRREQIRHQYRKNNSVDGDENEEGEEGTKKSTLGKMNENVSMLIDSSALFVNQIITKPFIDPVARKVWRLEKKRRRILRDILEISTIRVKKWLIKINGNFDEASKELKYEISRQYVQHQIQEARLKIRKEFQVIETVRESFSGASKEMAFIAWKKWAWTKQTRMRRDLRKKYKMAVRGFIAAMESVRSAQLQVDMWLPQQDIYTDTPFWQHARTGGVTMDEPRIYHFLPSNFTIPDHPEELPSDVSMNSTSSDEAEGEEETNLAAWQKKYGANRQGLVAKEEERMKKKRGNVTSSAMKRHSRNRTRENTAATNALNNKNSEENGLGTGRSYSSTNSSTTNTQQSHLHNGRYITSQDRQRRRQEREARQLTDGMYIEDHLRREQAEDGEEGGELEGEIDEEEDEEDEEEEDEIDAEMNGTGEGEGEGNKQPRRRTTIRNQQQQRNTKRFTSINKQQRHPTSMMIPPTNVSSRQSSRQSMRSSVAFTTGGGASSSPSSPSFLRPSSSSRLTFSPSTPGGDGSQPLPRHSQHISQMMEQARQAKKTMRETMKVMMSFDDASLEASQESSTNDIVKAAVKRRAPSLQLLPSAMTTSNRSMISLPPVHTANSMQSSTSLASQTTVTSATSSNYQATIEQIQYKQQQKKTMLTPLEKTLLQINLEMPELAAPIQAMEIEPTPIAEAAETFQKKANEEFEKAYKEIRRKRNQLNPNRHKTYMDQINRKVRSFEQLQDDEKAGNNEHIIEIEEGVFVDDRKIDFLHPSDEELLKLAGGEKAMIFTGKEGVELRTVLAQRALRIKEKLHGEAVKRGLAKPHTFYDRQLKPLFMHQYHDSSSEDEEKQEQHRTDAKKAIKAQKKFERKEGKVMQAKMMEKTGRASSPS